MAAEHSRKARGKPPHLYTWLAALFMLLPLALYAYLGQFSRLMSDDYCAVAVGKELGAWQGTVYWYSSWAGSYANFFLKSALAPLDVWLPRLSPLVIIVLWTLGAYWLAGAALKALGCRARRLGALAIACALVTASLNAFYSPQSFYWFAASTHYALPLALLTIYLALCARALLQEATALPGRWLLLLLAGALLCFGTAGASEIFVVFQLTLLTLCLLAALGLWRSLCLNRLKSLVMVLGAGWLATLIGFLLQVFSPGLAARAAADAALLGLAIRTLPDLFAGTLSQSLQLLGHAPAFAGFMLLFSLAFLVTRYSVQARPIPSELGEMGEMGEMDAPRLAKRALGLGLGFQLLWLPVLWSHASDLPRFFGRFSAGYLLVVALNLLLIAGFLLALAQRRRLENWRRGRSSANLIVTNSLLLLVALLFALTQARSIHFRAASFLFTSALCLLFLGGAYLLALCNQPQLRRLYALSWFALICAVMSLAAIVLTALFGRGFVDARILAPLSFALVLPGLPLGAQFGIAGSALRQGSQSKQFASLLPARLGWTLALVITVGILVGNAFLLPRLQAYAVAWDARHQQLLSLRAADQRAAVVGPLHFDLADYVEVTALDRDPTNRCALRYYDLDAIRLAAP